MKTEISTKNGKVTIEGEAGTAAEKDLITHLARGIQGVTEVANNMTVKG
jgi:osmotically-inducible protein OsmY